MTPSDQQKETNVPADDSEVPVEDPELADRGGESGERDENPVRAVSGPQPMFEAGSSRAARA